MKIIIGCECSGRVREAMRARGHDVWSCDLLPSEIPGQHIQDDILKVIGGGWDLGIFHPPCTYLCNAGNKHYNPDYKHFNPQRLAWRQEALDFVAALLAAPIPKIALENPIGCISSHIRKPDQIINPWQFGEPFHKPTCLWLKNLPLLTPTNIVSRGEFHTTKGGNKLPAWYNLPPGPERAKIRSRTFQGIADAMAAQWG